MNVHFFVPTWEPGAVGTHVMHARTALRSIGVGGEVFAGVVRGSMPGEARPLESFGGHVQPGDVLCYQHAIGSPVAEFVAARPETLVVHYHNVTPPEFFEAWDRPLADALDWGRKQLRALARRSALGLACSPFSERELHSAGFPSTAVAPVMFEPGRGARSAAAPARSRDWLFVGRLAPNKAQHDVIKAFALYRRTYDSDARLWLVGSAASARYRDALVRFVGRADLEGAVHLTGAVADDDLAARYDAAGAFVCLSRHEGFCVPVIEAMAHDLPVVARASTAVTGTVAGGGVLLDERAPLIDVATAVARVMADDAVRWSLVEAGRARARTFEPARTQAVFLDAMRPLLGAAVAA